MPMRDLLQFLQTKNKALNITKQQVCVNEKNAYHRNYVGVTTTIDLLQSQLLTHIEFDVGKNTEDCEKKLKKREEMAQLSNYLGRPIKWTDKEFLIPICTLFVMFIFLSVSLTMNILYCSGRIKKSGPR